MKMTKSASKNTIVVAVWTRTVTIPSLKQQDPVNGGMETIQHCRNRTKDDNVNQVL